MREIKFRMFCTTFPDKPLAFRYFDFSKIEDINKFREARISNPSSKIMQFTGLKDKNGKEVYEGDIVRIESYPTEVVGWITPENWMGEKCPVNGFVNHESIYKIKPKIIGNIYENPELLSKLNN